MLAAPARSPTTSAVSRDIKNVYETRVTRYSEVQCGILCSLEAELQKRFEHHDPCDMMRELKLIFETHAAVESYEASKQFFSCMMEEGSSVSEHMFAMSGHAKKLSDMGMMIPNQLGIHRVLQSLPPSYKNFVMNYNMQNMNKDLPELFSMLKSVELEIKKENQGKGHWKRNCPKYLADLKSGHVKKEELRNEAARDEVTMRVGNGSKVDVIAGIAGERIERSRSPDTVEEAWRLKCKYSAAGSRRAACKYAGAEYVPEPLREYAAGGRWYKQDPPLKPMSGDAFEKWLADWQRDRASKAAWRATIGSSSGGGSGGGDEEEEAAEEEAAFRQEEAAAIAQVEAFEARQAREAREAREEAARIAFIPYVILDD
ncbi:hypothetical protein QYE76_055167 [Lolium multiflorum]|uniref:Uncharacterized protein n=1 Tax=Lolium multiflorum TaxID=4521 RepID=A0AAD8T0U4_LOLMU|nr:hypothetical protein QYE76_055167 [Lolium multiflorum]